MFLGEQFVDELKEGSLLSIRDDSLTDYKKDDRTDVFVGERRQCNRSLRGEYLMGRGVQALFSG